MTEGASPVSDAGNVVTEVDPARVRRVHVVGVAGTGMGSFAGLLEAAGYTVTGSDQNVYPPMSDMLHAWGIPVMTPYAADNLERARPDLVIIGNVVRRVNPEATAVRERGLPQMSFPAALGSLFLAGTQPLVVAGTHGKTTTTAMLAHVLTHAGKDPSVLVGGVPLNSGSSFRLGRGPHFVVEGDEYDTAYFDKGPKFLHYRPHAVVLTSMELDHADMYASVEAYEAAFAQLLALVPPDGVVAVSASWPRAVALARDGRGHVVTYGAAGDAEVTARGLWLGPDGAHFEILRHGTAEAEVDLPVGGRHNVENALGVWAVARALGLSAEELAPGLASFSGVKRRQELRGEPGGIAVVDDFAHHPTAVRETISAVAARFPGRRLWAVFEPRSNTSRRSLHQEAYVHAFTGASRVLVRIPEKHDRIPPGEELDAVALTARIHAEHGIPAEARAEVEGLVALLAAEARAGDVVLVMSNGAFGGLVPRLLEVL